MMAAAVCLGKQFSPNRLFSLGCCWSFPAIPRGDKGQITQAASNFRSCLAPTHISSCRSSVLQNLSWAVFLQNLPRARLRRHPDADPSPAACPAAVLCRRTAATSPCPPTRQWLSSSAKQGALRHRQINDVPTDSQRSWNRFRFPRGWWFTNAPRSTVRFASRTLQISALL